MQKNMDGQPPNALKSTLPGSCMMMWCRPVSSSMLDCSDVAIEVGSGHQAIELNALAKGSVGAVMSRYKESKIMSAN